MELSGWTLSVVHTRQITFPSGIQQFILSKQFPDMFGNTQKFSETLMCGPDMFRKNKVSMAVEPKTVTSDLTLEAQVGA